jgi:transcriptional regulatory protein RtcR
MLQKNVIIGWVGKELDKRSNKKRSEKWRPTISLFQHASFPIERYELLYQSGKEFEELVETVMYDIKQVSPRITVRPHLIDFPAPWNFPEVYRILYKFFSEFPFDVEREDYFLHLTTGTHVSQICMFLLAEAKIFPGKLIQTSPPLRNIENSAGTYEIVDLGHSDFDRIRSRVYVEEQTRQGVSHLKDGIETRNEQYNSLIGEIYQIAVRSRNPILLLGQTGVGKTKLAERIHKLKLDNKIASGKFIKVNCATIKYDGAMSALFGHIKGAFTDAKMDRKGLLLAAHKGVLFLDEIAELGLGEQAMLLHALEEKEFFPVGADERKQSDFQLIAGTNADLSELVERKLFREDLLARLEHWKFVLPGLKDRVEDIEPNIDFELKQFSSRNKQAISFTLQARRLFVEFAKSPSTVWKRNFRDLNRAIDRMATVSSTGQITVEIVKREIAALASGWSSSQMPQTTKLAHRLLTNEQLKNQDEYDLILLEGVLAVCRRCRTCAEASRKLFARSLPLKKKKNDSDRLSKYLQSFGIKWSDIQNLTD